MTQAVLEPLDAAEPRVVTADVRRLLMRIVKPHEEGAGESVALIAEKADTSTRTVYRVLSDPPASASISLDLADRLALAADAHLSECRLSWPDGSVTGYR